MEWIKSLGINLVFWSSAVIYLIPLKRRLDFGKRFFSGLIVGNVISIGMLVVWWNQFETTGMFLMFYGLIVAFLCWCADINLASALYCGVWGLLTHQTILEIWGFLLWDKVQNQIPYMWGQAAVMLMFFAAGVIAVGLTIARWMPEQGEYRIGPRQLGSAIVLLLLFEMLLEILLVNRNTPTFTFERLVTIFAQVYCLTILYMQNALFKKSAMSAELRVLNMLHRQQEKQYAVSKENIDLINQKCHDLKHQIAALRDIVSEEEREEYLKEIEDSIQIYSAIVKTGNEVLDTLLTEKSLQCVKRNISIDCAADGTLLTFFDPVDLYTIFGNAIDNAVESVEKLAEQEKRQIDVMVYRQQNFLLIHIVNPIADTLRFEDDLPVTTKKDKDYHGYGLKSIRRTVKKYDGFVTISTEDDWFSLKILIPLRDS